MDGAAQRTFLVERFLPSVERDDVSAAAERLKVAARGTHDGDGLVVYLGTMLVPEDEVVFHMVAAAAAEHVERVCRQADIAFERIVESEAVPDKPAPVGILDAPARHREGTA